MRFPDIAQKILAKDPLQLVKAVFDRIPSKPFDAIIFYVLRASMPLENLGGDAKCMIRPATVDDIEGMCGCQNKKEKFLSRFRNGDNSILALADGRVIGYLWYCSRSTYIEERTGYALAVPEDAVYTYDEYVLPDFRKLGILNRLFGLQSAWMEKNRKSGNLVIIDYDNKISMAAHEKKGFKKIRKVLYFKIFSRKFFLESDVGKNAA